MASDAPPPTSQRSAGFVSLVGAGPGDPGLITVAGAERIAAADVIVHDRLANPALLRGARGGAELIYAGKLPDRHTLTQDEINTVLVEQARRGKRVVRLKGGDPFVFGRGGEEAEALVAAGIPFEVVPGVTSAIAAPAYAGIPVTHRAVASSFAVITGHEDPAKDDTSIDWSRLALGVDTLVFLMGIARLDEIARRLIEHGRAPATPAAVVEWGTHPRQRTVTGTVESIARDAAAAGITSPAVTVVGDVVSLREHLRWFDRRPLTGKRVLVTRTRHQASDLSRLLEARGAEVIELPSIEIAPCADEREVARALETLRTAGYGWVVFTSANAVDEFMRHTAGAGLDARAFGRTRIAAIGSGTGDALARHGLRVDLLPERYVAEGLLEAMTARPVRGVRVLLPRASGARETLVDGLQQHGAIVDELVLYAAAVPEHPDGAALQRLRDGEIDVATFASSSSVRNLVTMLGGDASSLKGVAIAAIGPITAEAIGAQGLEVRIMPEQHTIEALVDAIVAAESGAI